MDCTIHVAKTKSLISFAVTAKLICVLVFKYAKSGFLITRLSVCSGCEVRSRKRNPVTRHNILILCLIASLIGLSTYQMSDPQLVPAQ